MPLPFRGVRVSAVDEGWALGIAWAIFLAMLVLLAYVVLRRPS